VASLRAIPGVRLDVIAPDAYGSVDRAGYGLELFHLASPAVLPEAPTLYVLPPASNALVELAKPVVRPLVSSWHEPHPLTRYVNFSLFRPVYARPVRPEAAGESVVEIPEGPIVFTTEHAGRRQVVLGFDPFPYLGRQNLPMSILTLNVLDWFFEHASAGGKATGEALSFNAARPGDLVVTPVAEKIALKPGQASYAETFHQGLYQVVRGRERELFPVNLQDAGESDLRRAAPIEIRGTGGASESASMLFSFWPHLLVASLMLLLLEWFVQTQRPAYRWRRPPGRPVSPHA
jgi:hypothetical protein